LPKLSAKIPAARTRPEMELLLLCACTCPDERRAERIGALLQENIDWVYLIRTALKHGVMPLLYWSLHTTYPEGVPKVTIDELRGHFHANVRRNLFLTRELLKILDLFEMHKIPVMPFKGPFLSASAYGNLSLRQFSDLDILVHKRDALKAKDLLISEGYRPTLQLDGAREAAYLQYQYVYQFGRNDGRVTVELHWEITWRYFSFLLPPEHLWERLYPVPFAGTTVLNLPPEDLLLLLCVHGSKHLWERLEWICDIAELCRTHQKIDWARILEQARRLGSERMLLVGLFLASDLLGTVLPKEVLQRIEADSVVISLAAQVYGRLFCETDAQAGLFEQSRFCLFHFRVRERLRDRFRYCLRTMMSPTLADLFILPLPPSLSFLYCLLKPIRYCLFLPIWRVARHGWHPRKLKWFL
jgi:hypothetical protein